MRPSLDMLALLGEGVGVGLQVGAWGPTTLLLGCASKSKLNLLLDQVPSVVFLRREQHEQLPSFCNAAVSIRLYSETSATLSSI